MPHHNAECNRNSDDQDDFDFLAQGAFFAEEQHTEATRAHQHAADRRGHAKANQNSDENETRIQSSYKKRWAPGRI